MERSYITAIILDVIAGYVSFLDIGLLEKIGLLLIITGIYSLTYPDLSLTLPISLLPFSVTSGSYLLLAVSGLVSVAPYYLDRRVTSFLITTGFSLVLLDYSTFLIVPFLVLVPILIYLKVDVRGFFGTFFIFLISAAVFFNQGLSDQLSSIAYYSLLFGVIGVILESRRVRLRGSLLFVPYALGSLLFPTPLDYYWWNPHSFYFSSNPFSLWLVSGYFPQVNTILGAWPLSHLLPVRFYIALLILLSGEASYFLFKRLGISKPWLPALVYQLLSPFPYPYLLLGYSVLPVTALLLTLKARNEVKYPAIMISSMIGSSFPFFLLSAGLLSVREKNFPWLILGMVGANAFWLLPYLVSGFPTESVEITSSFALLIPVLVLLAKFERGKVIVPLLSLVYMLSGLPLSYAFYPIAILSTLLLFKDTDIRKVASAVIVSILLLGSFLQFSHYSVAQVPSNVAKIDGEIENATLVWWNDSYPLLSSAPINFTPLPLNFIQYVVSHGKVMRNVNYTGFPVSIYPLPPSNVFQVNGSWVPETIPIPFNFSDYNKTPDLLVNGSLLTSISSEQYILWKAPNESFVVNFSGNWTSYLPYPAVVLGSNSTFVEVWLGGHYPVYLFGREIKLLGTTEPVDLPGNFSLLLSFAKVGNFTFLEGEKVDNEFYPISINTTLPWNDAREFGLELPIRNQLSLNVSLNKFVPINITRDYISWDSAQPYNVSFYPTKPVNGTLIWGSLTKIYVNGRQVANGSFVVLNNLTLSGVGKVNITYLILKDNGRTLVILGKPYKVSLSNATKQILGGVTEVIKSNVNVSLYLLTMNIQVKVNGKPELSGNYTFPAGVNVVQFIFPGEAYLIIGTYVTLLSFAIAVLQGKVRPRKQ